VGTCAGSSKGTGEGTGDRRGKRPHSQSESVACPNFRLDRSVPVAASEYSMLATDMSFLQRKIARRSARQMWRLRRGESTPTRERPQMLMTVALPETLLVILPTSTTPLANSSIAQPGRAAPWTSLVISSECFDRCQEKARPFADFASSPAGSPGQPAFK
jgi:hypothetical protein